jgi:hypothetical protein
MAVGRGCTTLSRNELISSLFDTAAAYIQFTTASNSKEKSDKMERLEKEKWRHVEIVIGSEPSSEPCFFSLSESSCGDAGGGGGDTGKVKVEPTDEWFNDPEIAAIEVVNNTV